MHLQSESSTLDSGAFELGGQLKHSDVLAAEYVSVPHAKHVEAAVAAVAAEYVPAEHCVHASLPFVALYVPSMHAEHAPPSDPV